MDLQRCLFGKQIKKIQLFMYFKAVTLNISSSIDSFALHMTIPLSNAMVIYVWVGF